MNDDVKIQTVEQAVIVIKALKEKLKNATNSVEKKDIKLEIIAAKQKMLALEKKIVVTERKRISAKEKRLASAAARKCRSHGLICIALGVLYQQHRIDEFEKICFRGNSDVERYAEEVFGYKKGETK